ncbi:MAG: hypothetical protein AAF357_16700, partial [Verrucomicrobiota bacterium]
WAPGLLPEKGLSAAEQAEVLTSLNTILGKACPLTADNADPDLQLEMIRFVQVEPEFGVIPDEREIIPLHEAQIAAVYAAAREGYPVEVSIQWNLFPSSSAEGIEAITEIPVHFASDAGSNTFFLTRSNPSQNWLVPQNPDRLDLLPLPELTLKLPEMKLAIPFFSVLLVSLGLALGIAARFVPRAHQILVGILAVISLAGSLLIWGIAGFPIQTAVDDPDSQIDPMASEELVHALLHNLYRSFDYRDESMIYDTLAESVSGDLLESVYLEIRRGLLLEEQGGPRVKIRQIDLRSSESVRLPDSGEFRADAEWLAVGDVTHWGHVHTRLNKYHAWLTIAPSDGGWKISGIDLIEEGRF